MGLSWWERGHIEWICLIQKDVPSWGKKERDILDVFYILKKRAKANVNIKDIETKCLETILNSGLGAVYTCLKGIGICN